VDNSAAYVFQAVSKGYGGLYVHTTDSDHNSANKKGSVNENTFGKLLELSKSSGRKDTHVCNMPQYDTGMAWESKKWQWE